MARRKKLNLTVEEQYKNVADEIAALNEQLAQKKEELKELRVRKAEEDKQRIMDAFNNSGKSFEEVLAFLNGDEYAEDEEYYAEGDE